MIIKAITSRMRATNGEVYVLSRMPGKAFLKKIEG